MSGVVPTNHQEFAEAQSPLEISLGIDGLIHYVADLEALIRWFALPFRWFDQGTQEWVQNEPIWTVYDERGTYLPEADRLQRTWNRVMETDSPSGST